MRLCDEVVQSWPVLKAFLTAPGGAAILPASRPVHWKKQPRAFIPRYHRRELDLIWLRARTHGRYLVQADVNNFYPSLYTHAIAWALDGKAKAKANRRSLALVGNRLDKLSMALQDGQSVGVPIGPDTSHLLAECVLRAVDNELMASVSGFSGVRYVDDYQMTCRTRAKAEEVLAQLTRALDSFGLCLNAGKTSIVELPVGFDGTWAHDLSVFEFRRKGRKESNSLASYFSLAFEKAHAHPNDHVIKYAVARLRNFRASSAESGQVLQAALLLCIESDPSALPTIMEVLSAHVLAGQKLQTKAVARVLADSISRHASLRHGSEVAWALWGALAFRVKLDLDPECARHLETMDDNVVALLALDAQRAKLLLRPLNLGYWSGLVSLDQLEKEHWLLAYEADRQGWLPLTGSNKAPIQAAFATMKKAGVSFYDQKRNRPHAPPAARSAPGGQLSTFSLPF